MIVFDEGGIRGYISRESGAAIVFLTSRTVCKFVEGWVGDGANTINNAGFRKMSKSRLELRCHVTCSITLIDIINNRHECNTIRKGVKTRSAPAGDRPATGS
jgi:hypothetical protein